MNSATRLESRWTLGELIPLLSQTIGEDKARDVIVEAARRLQLSLADGLHEQDVLSLLDDIAASPGIVGITARFAKSRVHLRSR